MTKIGDTRDWVYAAEADLMRLYGLIHKRLSGPKRTKKDLHRLVSEALPARGEVSPRFRRLWKISTRRSRHPQPATWLFRQYSVSKALKAVILDLAGLSLNDYLDGRIGEAGLAAICGGSTALAVSNPDLLDHCHYGDFKTVLEPLVERGSPCCVVCDWVLDRKELACLRQTAKGTKLDYLVSSVEDDE